MKIICSDNSYLRCIDDFQDSHWFAECMRDWPTDHHGEWTYARALRVCSKHAADCRRVHAPVTEQSRFNLIMVYCLEDGTRIGYRRIKVKGTNAHLAQNVIHPDFRGQGYSRKMRMPWEYLLDEVLDTATVSWETMPTHAPQIEHLSQDYSPDPMGEREGSTGNQVKAYSLTKEQYKQFTASSVAEKDDRDLTFTYEE